MRALQATGLRELRHGFQMFSRESDIFSFRGTNVRLGNKIWETALVEANWKEIRINKEVFPLEKLGGELKAFTDTLFIPREAMGFGDVKFLGAIGAFLGPIAIFFVILFSSFVGSFVGLLTMVIGKREWGLKLPYGPYLALGAIFWIFWGEACLHAYRAWIGP